MSDLKPQIKKSADSKFPGNDADYNNAVWNAVDFFGPAATGGRTLVDLNIDDRDFKRAYDYTYKR